MDTKIQLEQAKTLIKAKRFVEARQILEGTNHPTAQRWLEKIDEIEMFGTRSSNGIEMRQTESSANYAQNYSSQVLQDTAAIFLNNQWRVTGQFNGMIQFEKRGTPSSWVAAVLILAFSIIGTVIVLVWLAASKVEQVTLQINGDNALILTGSKGSFIVSNPLQVVSLAQSVREETTYLGAIGLGIISYFIWFVVRSS